MARQRARELTRQRKPRALKRRFVLFCEGANTEPGYFKLLVRLLNLRMVEIELVTAAGDPLGIAQKAARWKSGKGLRVGNLEAYDDGDNIWAVFDRDEHERFEEAVALCERKGISVARSNPCFEIWLILHLEDCHAPLTRHEAQRRVKALCPEYDLNGGKCVDAARLLQHLDAAEARAEEHLARRASEGAPHGASSTTVHLLTRAIREKA